MEFSKTLTVSDSFALRRPIKEMAMVTQIYYLSWVALAVLIIVDYYGTQYVGPTFTDPQLNLIVTAVLIALSVLFYGMFGAGSYVGTMMRYLALWIPTEPALRVLTYIFTNRTFPATDASLDYFDKILGFDWLTWYRCVNLHPWLQFVLNAAYVSAGPQIIVSIIYFSHRGEPNKNNEFWWMNAIALVITTFVAYFFPAMGAYEYFGAVGGLHGAHLHDLHGLREGTLTVVSLEEIRGLITMPSFHTVLAILLTYVYRDNRFMLSIALPLNLLMLVSIPSEGGHYLADMLAGGAVAALSIWIVARTFPSIVTNVTPKNSVGSHPLQSVHG